MTRVKKIDELLARYLEPNLNAENYSIGKQKHRPPLSKLGAPESEISRHASARLQPLRNWRYSSVRPLELSVDED